MNGESTRICNVPIAPNPLHLRQDQIRTSPAPRIETIREGNQSPAPTAHTEGRPTPKPRPPLPPQPDDSAARGPGGIGAWLAAAGLGHLEPAFRAEGIDVDQLAALTDAHLRELGLRIGDRLRFHAGLNARQADHATARTLPERRPLTVMFVDVVDSTGLSDRLDVEDLIEVIRVYREFCDAAIRQFGGHVAQFFGDGIMAYFCYPVAHEDDTERAVRAGLAIAAGVRTLATPAATPLHVRVGIATGRVIISDLFSGTSHEQRKVTGATPNLAARLQALAQADGVVISELTHELAGGRFVCEDAGRQDMRGFGAPQHVFHVLGVHDDSRAKPVPNARLTPLFGRDLELDALARHWARATAGQGGTALVVGEAGIGKSRLVERFLGTLRPNEAALVRIQATGLDRDSPLRPVIGHFRQIAGFAPGDAADARIGKLRAILRGPAQADDAEILAELLQVRAAPALSALTPAALRERALAALLRQLLALAEHAPLCLVVEDLHWLDPTSMDLLARLAATIADRRVMVLATSRDETDGAPLPEIPGAASIRLTRLATADVVTMVQSLFGDEPVPLGIARQIAGKTDGIPLFVEEYVRPLLLAHARTDWNTVASRAMEASVIPTSLHDSLMARLDRSGPAKEVAQIAAVIGRIARRDVLAAAAGLPPAVLEAALLALHAAGVLHPMSDDGRDCYAFGHALVRETAYDSILRDRRRTLHGRVATALLAQDPEGVELQPELLATHLTEAGRPDRALDYWVRASERSVRRSSLFEAVGLLRRALAAADGLADTPERERSRLKLMALLGPTLIATSGPGSAEAQKLYADAYDLAEAQTESRSHFPLAWGWWRVSRDYTIKQQRAATLLTRATRRADHEMLLQAHHCNWAAHFELGDFCTCVAHVRAGLGVYAAHDCTHHAAMYGNHDARVCAHGELSQVFWMQGHLAEAAAEEARALAWADGLAHLGSRVHAMDMALLHRSFQRDNRAVQHRADRLVAFTAEHGMPDHRAKGQIFAGWAAARAGDPARGLEAIRTGIERQREIGTLEDFPMYVSMHAEALVAAGMPERAIEQLRSGRAEFDAVGLRIWVPEVMRQLGLALLAADPAATAAAHAAFDEAGDLARQQGAAMLGLRVALDQARLARRGGDPERARTLLAAALAGLPPGAEAPETAAATALLAEIDARLAPAR